MQNDEPYPQTRFESALSPAFEYCPPAGPKQRSSAASETGSLHGHAREDPDDYYRSYAEHSPRPDPSAERIPNVMATVRKRTGSHASPGASPSARNRTSPSSLPIPISQRSPHTSTATSGGSVRDRVRLLDTNSAREPSRPETSPLHTRRIPSKPSISSDGPPAQPSSRRYTSPKASSKSPARTRRNSAQQRSAEPLASHLPLFGEIVDQDNADPGVGHGIAGIRQPHTVRKSKSHNPNAVNASGQKWTESSVPSGAKLLDNAMGQSQELPSHRRSQEGDQAKGSPPRFTSRIPVATNRLSDDSPPRVSASEDATPGADTYPTVSQGQIAVEEESTQRRTPLKSRRYSPKRSMEPSQALNAVFKTLPLKESPALRSSRPRQPVAAAAYSTSKPQISNTTENIKLRGTRAHSVDNPASPQRPTPDAPAASTFVLSNHNKRHDAGVHVDARGLASPETIRAQPETPEDVAFVLKPTVYEKSTEIIASSIRGPSVIAGVAKASPSRGSILPEPRAFDITAAEAMDLDYERSSSDPQMQVQSEQAVEPHLLAHILGMRQSLPADTPRTRAVSDFLSEKDDGETIQIILGATPTLPSVSWIEQDPMGESGILDALPGKGGPPFSSLFYDNRSSIHPDDSVSVVFGKKPRGYKSQLATASARHDAVSGSIRSGQNLNPDTFSEQDLENGQSPTVPRFSRASEAGDTDSSTDTYRSAQQLSNSALLHGEQRFSTCSSTSDEEYTGTALIYDQPRDLRMRSEVTKSTDHQPHSHTSSNATVRAGLGGYSDPVMYQRNTEIAPSVPPKDTHPSGDHLNHPQFRFPASQDVFGVASSVNEATPPLQQSMRVQPLSSTEAFSPAKLAQMTFSEATSFYDSKPRVVSPQREQNQRNRLLAESRSKSQTSIDTSRQRQQMRPGSFDGRIHETRNVSAPLPDSGSARAQNKELTERRNCIKELVDTESSYSVDLTIMEDIYKGTAHEVLDEDDRRVLFGNLSQVRAFSLEFFDTLRQAASPIYTIPRGSRSDFLPGSQNNTESPAAPATFLSEDEWREQDGKTTIGHAFLSSLARIEKIYGDWIVKTNDAANNRLKELQLKPTVKMWLDECHDSAHDLTSAWSLDALIIKPAQRLMKYPLLLSALLKSTPPGHPDHNALKQANEAMVSITTRINEAKKRAELVDQAMNRKRKDSESKMRVGKLLNRRTEKLKQQVGLTNVSEDQEYEAIAQKFGGHYFQLQIVMRDIEKYLEDVQISIGWLTNFLRVLVGYSQLDGQERWPEIESNWIKFAHLVQVVYDLDLKEHLSEVRQSVIEPIHTLWRLFDGPQRMMQKRKKRLVDHVRFKTVVTRGEKVDKKLQMEEDEYNAVNEVLKEELPKLYSLTKKLIEASLSKFVTLQVQWQDVLKRRLEESGDVAADHLDLNAFITELESAIVEDSSVWDLKVKALGICNGSTLAEVQTFSTPSMSIQQDDNSSGHRPSTMGSSRRTLSLNGDQASLNTPSLLKSGDQLNPHITSPLLGGFGVADGMMQGFSTRTRASSAISSRGPSTPHSLSTQGFQQMSSNSSRPSLAYDRGPDSSNSLPRLDTTNNYDTGFSRDPATSRSASSVRHSADERFSGIFNSALPVSDSPRSSSPQPMPGEVKILFLAASLFEFNIDGSRKEGGYPYLRYIPGEIFDVIGQKGELWLAKNQDDPHGTVGWIWEKHFARILPDDP